MAQGTSGTESNQSRNRFGVTAATVALIATFGVGFGANHLADAVHHRESVPTSELSRLASCDAAVRAASAYDSARASGGDAGGALSAYWSAKAACRATETTEASK